MAIGAKKSMGARTSQLRQSRAASPAAQIGRSVAQAFGSVARVAGLGGEQIGELTAAMVRILLGKGSAVAAARTASDGSSEPGANSS